MSEMKKIVVDNGGERYAVEDKLGNYLGEFVFNPTDTRILQRYEETVPQLSELMGKDHGADVSAVFALEDEIREKVDYIFGSGVSSTFFNTVGPLTVLGTGELYVVNVVNALAQVIDAEIGVRTKKMENMIRKYTDKYSRENT